jgi:quinolinate synthase
MRQATLPDWVTKLSEQELRASILQNKAALGKHCVILGHHYQRPDVIEFADITGDSLKLAQYARSVHDAKNIVFCGVHFMAETADILIAEHQRVYLPDLEAGCDMADMADLADVETAWDDAEGIEHIVPVTYINSSAALKAFVGKHGGIICTSSNAKATITWALERGKHVFFFPDQHLGRNVSKALGLDPQSDMLLWDPKEFRGGHSLDELKDKRIWLWKGHCPVHALFALHHINKLRTTRPEVRIIVHPECAMEVVDHADLVGSTEFIVQQIAASPPGSSWAVGTEKHLVERLTSTYKDKDVFSLNPFTCLCGTMNRISLRHLAWMMHELAHKGESHNRIQVHPKIKADAMLALQRMFEVS